MPSLSDARFAALRTQLPGSPPHTNDLLRDWLLANGATGAALPDLWYSFYIAQGGTAGLAIPDLAREFLTNEGFTQPHVNDAWLAFWLAGGVPTGGGPPPDPLDIDETFNSPPGFVTVEIDFNNFTQVFGTPQFIRFTTFAFEQFGLGIHNITTELVLNPPSANLDNNRYRARRRSGDEATNSSFFPTNLAIDAWSAWRGGNPGAPLQADNFDYQLFAPGSLSGVWQVQVEEPDGSSTIVIDRTFTMSLTRT